tara:strand:- start:565 stop:888 length:324 start_codon:yes stop_codon:yes gene_type:complete
MGVVTIDGKLYDRDTLGQDVINQVAAIQQCDSKIIGWNMDIAMAQTARVVYAAELNLLLEQCTVVGAEKVEVVEAEEVDEVDEVEILSAEEVDEVEVLEAEEIEANR